MELEEWITSWPHAASASQPKLLIRLDQRIWSVG